MPARRPALHVKFSAQPTVSHLHRDNVMLAYRSISVTWQKLGHWKNASSEYQKEDFGERSARIMLTNDSQTQYTCPPGVKKVRKLLGGKLLISRNVCIPYKLPYTYIMLGELDMIKSKTWYIVY